MPVTVPCGQCIGCKLEKSRQWAVRIMHEEQLHEESCFLTLTYSDDELPENGSLVKSHWQKFMKRLRKAYDDKNIRYFHCGEYGDRLQRPHYHAALFGLDPDDKELISRAGGNNLYQSPRITKIWGHGFVSIGTLTFESAAYIARYVTKKITGPGAAEFYGPRIPPYVTMSRRPAIGREWLDRFLNDVYIGDQVLTRDGIRCKPPKYYDKILEDMSPQRFQFIKNEREARNKKNADNNTLDRLAIREELQLIKLQQKERKVG